MNLVTGATGLLGSHIVAKLRQAGQDVRVLVRPNSDTAYLDTLGVHKAAGDVTDAASIRRAMQGVKRMYHSAARVGDWGPWPEFVAITIDGTRNMLDAAAAAGVERFLHISSISAYGHVNGEGKVFDETAPLGQNLSKWSYYSRAKVEAEKLVWAAHEAKRVPVTVIRPSWLYGERDRASMPRLIRAIRNGKSKIIGDGQNRMNLTYAGNEADGCILAAQSPQALGQAYNLCNDGTITQQGYMDAIAACIGAKPVARHVPFAVAYKAAFMMELFGHIFGRKTPPLVTRYSVWLIGRRCFFSSEKIRRELGWQPAVGYDEGIRRSVAWALEHAQPESQNMARKPYRAGSFYEADPQRCLRSAEKLLAAAELPPDLPPVFGGVVPHAGWVFSGRLAAMTLKALHAAGRLDSVVVLGADHCGIDESAALYEGDAWLTPLGSVPVDQALAKLLLDNCPLVRPDSSAHAREHAIEVQLPLMQVINSAVKIVPITVAPGASAPDVGKQIGQALKAHAPRAGIIASTNLTHYGPQYGFAPGGTGPAGIAWAKANDRRLIRLVETMQAQAICPETAAQHNACGGGALTAAVAACAALGASRAFTLAYTTSADVLAQLGQPGEDTAVGYASMVFV